MHPQTTVDLDLPCECVGETTHDFRCHNGVGKPIFQCQTCDDTNVGPLGAEIPDDSPTHRRARLAADGGVR